ncbi:hypothetical protein QTH97_07945 [Variovorax sp. J22R24]|uniref:hypothetical protein n=1 Tax=Variovorax gracilis TaxID=3053502 RepID=UPI00257546F9|nr:hypothetical protein [Variovorax sp. J22R24]MDM0104861.1 hypothetical protein [Variovorax sp. J22R24]
MKPALGTEKYAREMKSIYERWLRPRALWNARLNEIIVPMAVGALTACVKQSVSTGKKLRMIIQGVARYALGVGLVEHTELAALAETPKLRAYRRASDNGERHRPAMLDLADAGQILRDNDNVNAEWQLVRASLMCALLARQHCGDAVGGPEPGLHGVEHPAQARDHEDDRSQRRAWRHELLLPSHRALAPASDGVAQEPGSAQRVGLLQSARYRQPHYRKHPGASLCVPPGAGVHCPHGWRSTFFTWANDQTTPKGERQYSRDEIELILDHKVGSAVYRVYNRKVAIPRLRPILQAWADALYHAWHKATPSRARRKVCWGSLRVRRVAGASPAVATPVGGGSAGPCPGAGRSASTNTPDSEARRLGNAWARGTGASFHRLQGVNL